MVPPPTGSALHLREKLARVHGRLSETLLALTAALPYTAQADKQRVETIARLLTEAQRELVAMSAEC